MNIENIVSNHLQATSTRGVDLSNSFEGSYYGGGFGRTKTNDLLQIFFSVELVLDSDAIKGGHKIKLLEYKTDLLSHLETLKNNA